MSLNRSLSKMYQKKTAALNSQMNVSPNKPHQNSPLQSLNGHRQQQDDEEQLSKKRKLEKEIKKKAKVDETISRCISVAPTTLKLSHIGGLGKNNKDIIGSLLHFYRLGIACTTGEELRQLGGRRVVFPNLLLEGPKGTGKSMLATAMANELGIPCLQVDLRSNRFINHVASEAVSNLKIVFEAANTRQPCVLFLDNVDTALGSKKDSSTTTPSTNELMLELEEQIRELSASINDSLTSIPRLAKIILICSTNKSAVIDCDSKCEFESIQFSLPGHHDRLEILKIMSGNCSMQFGSDINFEKLAELTPAYVGADLDRLFICAQRNALLRTQSSENSSDFNHKLVMHDFEEAVKKIVPKLKISGFPQVPNVTWDDVGGHDQVKLMLKRRILQEIKCHQLTGDPIDYAAILMYGPPGCGKTHLAKALANEGNLNFLYVKGSELFNKYLGGTEKNIKSLFNTAKECAPCLIFFDEVDAICPPRSNEADTVGAKVNAVSALLNEMDGLVSRNCFMLGATNRKQAMDEAILRSGRFGHELYVGPPDAADRLRILNAILRQYRRPCGNDVSLDEIARETDGFTGADLKELVVEAKREAFAEALDQLQSCKQPTSLSDKSRLEQITIDRRHFAASYKIISDKLSSSKPNLNKLRINR